MDDPGQEVEVGVGGHVWFLSVFLVFIFLFSLE